MKIFAVILLVGLVALLASDPTSVGATCWRPDEPVAEKVIDQSDGAWCCAYFPPSSYIAHYIGGLGLTPSELEEACRNVTQPRDYLVCFGESTLVPAHNTGCGEIDEFEEVSCCYSFVMLQINTCTGCDLNPEKTELRCVCTTEIRQDPNRLEFFEIPCQPDVVPQCEQNS